MAKNGIDLNVFHTQDQLDAIAHREQRASKGPWWLPYEDGAIARPFDHRDRYEHPDADDIDDVFLCAVDEERMGIISRREDAEFIVHAREDVPQLLAEVLWFRDAVIWLEKTAAQTEYALVEDMVNHIITVVEIRFVKSDDSPQVRARFDKLKDNLREKLAVLREALADGDAATKQAALLVNKTTDSPEVYNLRAELRVVKAQRDHLAEHKTHILRTLADCGAPVADGGQYRADIASAIRFLARGGTRG